MTKPQLARRRREQAAYRCRTNVWPASEVVSDFPTPQPYIAIDNRDDWLTEPLHATEGARAQVIAWLLLDKNSAWRTRHGVADEPALDALIPPALFEDSAFGDNVVDSDDGQVTAPGGDFGTYRETHPEATQADFVMTTLRGTDVLEWEPGDPQP